MATRRRDRRRRAVAIVALVALLLVAFGAGYLLARGGSDGTGAASPSRPPRPSHTRSPRPTPSPAAGPTVSVTPSAVAVLPDGRSFVYARRMGGTEAAPTLTLDLAEFLTGQAAADAAAAHGDESPPPNGYYIVNDNPLLRTLPVAPTATITYLPAGGPGLRRPGTLAGFAAAVNGTAMTDYPDMRTAPWWITVRDGEIVRIAQQYLP